MFGEIFKSKTRDQHIEKRVGDVFLQLTKIQSDGIRDVEFTELETVQILNSLRRKTHEWLSEKKAHCLEQSTLQSQKAAEIKNAIELIE